MAHKNERPTSPEHTPRVPARASSSRLGAADLQGTAGNMAMVQLLRQSGHPWAQPASAEQHQHGAGCGHQATPQAESTEVQRAAAHDTLRAPGRPLDEGTRAEMESRLGADFSDVRIHDDSAARASATEIGARAYTSGSHVVIGEGGGDKHTLAHELTHVIQQRQGPVAGTDNGSGLKLSDPSDRFEREAEASATRAMSTPLTETQSHSAPLPVARSTSHTPAVQRAQDRRNRGNNDNQANQGTSNGQGQGTGTVVAGQGDHLFNKLADAAVQLAGNAVSRLDAAGDEVSRSALRALAGRHRVVYTQSEKAFLSKKDEMLEKAAEASAARHPTTYPEKTFFTAKGVASGAGGDANSQTFGTFSSTLVSLPGLCGRVAGDGSVEPLVLPTDVAAARGTWNNLKDMVFDADAHRRKPKELDEIEKGRYKKAAFPSWVSRTQDIYVELYELMLSTVEHLHELLAVMHGGGFAASANPANLESTANTESDPESDGEA